MDILGCCTMSCIAFWLSHHGFCVFRCCVFKLNIIQNSHLRNPPTGWFKTCLFAHSPCWWTACPESCIVGMNNVCIRKSLLIFIMFDVVQLAVGIKNATNMIWSVNLEVLKAGRLIKTHTRHTDWSTHAALADLMQCLGEPSCLCLAGRLSVGEVGRAWPWLPPECVYQMHCCLRWALQLAP